MPTIDVVDSIQVQVAPEIVFDTVLDYASWHTWCADYRCQMVAGEGAGEGARFAHHVVAPIVRVSSRFVRTVQRVARPSRIEETYDEGDLVGEGVWSFEAGAEGWTTASFHCRVRSNNPFMHLGFLVAGELGHRMTYRRLLAALKIRCEK